MDIKELYNLHETYHKHTYIDGCICECGKIKDLNFYTQNESIRKHYIDRYPNINAKELIGHIFFANKYVDEFCINRIVSAALNSKRRKELFPFIKDKINLNIALELNNNAISFLTKNNFKDKKSFLANTLFSENVCSNKDLLRLLLIDNKIQWPLASLNQLLDLDIEDFKHILLDKWDFHSLSFNSMPLTLEEIDKTIGKVYELAKYCSIKYIEYYNKELLDRAIETKRIFILIKSYNASKAFFMSYLNDNRFQTIQEGINKLIENTQNDLDMWILRNIKSTINEETKELNIEYLMKINNDRNRFLKKI